MLSKTLTDPSWPTARIVHDIDEIRVLRQQPGKAVYVVGGLGLVASLINAGLLDELRLIVHPVVTEAELPSSGASLSIRHSSSCRPNPRHPAA